MGVPAYPSAEDRDVRRWRSRRHDRVPRRSSSRLASRVVDDARRPRWRA